MRTWADVAKIARIGCNSPFVFAGKDHELRGNTAACPEESSGARDGHLAAKISGHCERDLVRGTAPTNLDNQDDNRRHERSHQGQDNQNEHGRRPDHKFAKWHGITLPAVLTNHARIR
jgi:hypothetical protein